VKPTYTYNAKVERVVDGDTIDVEIDMGMRIYSRTRLRVAHVDTPELSTERGKLIRDDLRERMPVGTEVVVLTQKPDKYGRALADIEVPGIGDLATYLIDNGMATPYEGGAKA
jgi:micrococcal nuclease